LINKENDNFSFLDVARGIAIFLVVVAHSFVPEIRSNNKVFGTMFSWIASCDMAIFTVLSGYLFGKNIDRYKDRGLLTFVKQKFQTLIIPYLSVSIITYIGYAIAHQFPFLSAILSNSGYDAPEFWRSVFQILTYQGNMDMHMWFAYALFFVFAFSFLLSGLIRRPIGIAVTAVLFVLNYYVITIEVLYRVFYLWIFFTIACQDRLIDTVLKKKYLFAVIPVHIIAYIIRHSGVLVPFRVADALLAMVVGLSAAIMVLSITKNFLHSPANRVLSFLGKNSFSIYLLHQPFIVSGISGILLFATDLPYIVICVVTIILGITIPLFLSEKIISKSMILQKLILGKQSPAGSRSGG